MNERKRPEVQKAASCLQSIFEASGKRSLIVTGEKQSGKTTVLQAMLAGKSLPGFQTHLQTDAVHQSRSVWLTDNLTQETAQIGQVENGVMTPVLSGFETLGLKAVAAAECAESEFALIDELGFLESNCPAFCDAVTHLFTVKRLFAAVRKQALPFLDALKQREDVCCVDLDALYETMLL
ncbi:MAG: nucleoside-triphosphatase [Ruthenibacterium sp.]